MRILSIFLTVWGAVLLLWVAIDHGPLLIQVFGRTAPGYVTGREVDFHGREQEAESGVLTMIYEFEIGGSKRQSKCSVNRAVYDAAEPGKRITVYYFSPSPSVNFPEGYMGQGFRGLPILIMGLASFCAGLWLMRRAAQSL